MCRLPTARPRRSIGPPSQVCQVADWFYFILFYFCSDSPTGSRATRWHVQTCIPPCPPDPQQWRIDQGRQPHLRPPQSCVGQTRPRQIDNITRRQGCMRCGAGFCERNAQTPTPQFIFHLALRSKEGSDTTQARKAPWRVNIPGFCFAHLHRLPCL